MNTWKNILVRRLGLLGLFVGLVLSSIFAAHGEWVTNGAPSLKTSNASAHNVVTVTNADGTIRSDMDTHVIKRWSFAGPLKITKDSVLGARYDYSMADRDKEKYFIVAEFAESFDTNSWTLVNPIATVTWLGSSAVVAPYSVLRDGTYRSVSTAFSNAVDFAEFTLPAKCAMKFSWIRGTGGADPRIFEISKNSVTDTNTPTGDDLAYDSGTKIRLRDFNKDRGTGLFAMQLSGELLPPEVPRSVSIARTESGDLRISWDVPSPGYFLEASYDLSPEGWFTVWEISEEEMEILWSVPTGTATAAAASRVALKATSEPPYPPYVGVRFFRLMKP